MASLNEEKLSPAPQLIHDGNQDYEIGMVI
jgi:hypothetical protein